MPIILATQGAEIKEDFSSKPAQANSSRDPILKKPSPKIGLVEWLKVKALNPNNNNHKKNPHAV
jgi:hypothetical protein